MTARDIRDITSFKWGTVTGTSPLGVQLDGDTAPLALIPDSLVDPLELWVDARVRVELSLRKVVIHGVSNGGGVSGEIKLTASATAPSGWFLCQGQSLLRSDYPRLFAAIGTTYGSVDGTHFSLPDTRGRVAVGIDPAQGEFDALGKKGGANTHTLTTAEMPSHSHEQYVTANSGGPASRLDYSGDNSGQVYPQGVNTGSAGGNGSHNNLQPYIVLNYIIKL